MVYFNQLQSKLFENLQTNVEDCLSQAFKGEGEEETHFPRSQMRQSGLFFLYTYYDLMAKKSSHVRGFGLCFLPS